MKKKLTITGALILFPIWIFLYTPMAKQILITHDTFSLVLCTIIVMFIGLTLMFIGIFKEDSK